MPEHERGKPVASLPLPLPKRSPLVGEPASSVSSSAEGEPSPSYIHAVIDHVKAPFAVGGFLALSAQLLGVNGWFALALVIIGGTGAVLAHWRWKTSRWQALPGGGISVAAFVGILLLTSFATPTSPLQPSQSPTALSASTTNVETPAAVGAPDPNLFLAFDGQPLGRKQECPGLLGLCLGQPISFAIEIFGTTEAKGHPVVGGNSEFTDATQCHAWEPRNLDRVEICEQDGAIYSVRIFSFADTDIMIAAPNDLRIALPEAIAYNAEDITDALRTTPFSSAYLQDEGASVYSYAWFFPEPGEGYPGLKIEIVGRDAGNFPDDIPAPCSEELVRYRYADILPLSRQAATFSVEISPVMPRDLNEPTNC